MALDRSAERVRREIMRLCHRGLEPLTLLQQTFERLQRVVPVDAWFAATVDPATLLYTSTIKHEMPETGCVRLVNNEFMQADVNKFVTFARGRAPVGSLYGTTAGKPERSARYRDIYAPMGLGDELRGALKVGTSTWGVFCLNRELGPAGFSADEAAFLRELASHLGEGIRASLLLGGFEEGAPGAEPGLLMLSDALTVLATTPAAELWLAEMGDWLRTGEIAHEIVALAAQLQALERGDDIAPNVVPRARVRTRRGHWVTLHASRLSRGGQIAIIFERARALEVAPLLLEAYALTPRELRVAQLVLQGLTTAAIAADLCITPLTVQQHLKAIFEKMGVRSRRELVAQVFHQQYHPRTLAGEQLGADGWFARSNG